MAVPSLAGCEDAVRKLPVVTASSILPRVRYAIIGIDPGLGGKQSDEAHCIFLVTENEIVVLGGQVIAWDEPLIRPFDHVRLFIELARITDTVLSPCAADIPILVAVESNLAHMGGIYLQAFSFLYHREITKHQLIFVGGIPPLGKKVEDPDVPAEEGEEEEEKRKKKKAKTTAGKMDEIEHVLMITEQTLPQPVQPPIAPTDPVSMFNPKIGLWINSDVKIENRNYYVAIMCNKTHHMKLKVFPDLPVNTTNTRWKSGRQVMQICHEQMWAIRKEWNETSLKNTQKTSQHDDMYMAVSNTFGWITRFHQMGPQLNAKYYPYMHKINVAIMHTVLSRATAAGAPVRPTPTPHLDPALEVQIDPIHVATPRSTLLHYTAMISAARRLAHRCRIFLYHTILFLWDGQPMNENSRYAIEKSTRMRPIPIALYRSLLERIFNHHAARRKEEYTRHSSSWHVLRFTNTNQKPWFPVPGQKLDNGVQTLLTHIKRFLVLCIEIQHKYGSTHRAWADVGSSNVVGMLMRHLYDHVLTIYGSLLPVGTDTLVPGTTAKAVSATPPRPPPGASSSLQPASALFYRYFQILGYERFLSQAYTQHRLALIANLQQGGLTHVSPTESESGIGVVMRHQSRVRYADVLASVLRNQAELYSQVMRFLKKQTGTHKTDIYTITLLT